jgi:hypothetical protein
MERRPSNPLSAQAQLLQEQYEQTLRELAEAEKALRRKPKGAAPAKPAPERKVRLNNLAAAISLPRPQDHTFRGGTPRAPRRNTRRRKTDARLAQVKFLLLCLLLAGLFIFVWKHLPG